MARVCVYAIAKNEAKHVGRWLESCTGADSVLLVDTGSDDGTLETLGIAADREPRIRDVRCVQIHVLPWRFDIARNTALSLVPPDVEWCVTLDLDEVLTAGWRRKFDEAVGRSPDAAWVRYGYVWSWKDDQPSLQFRANRTHRRRGFRWRYACHESLEAYGLESGIRDNSYADFEGTMIEHHADNSKSRGDYLPLLELAEREDPNSRRCQLYARREKLFRLHGETGGKGMSMAYVAFAREAWPTFPVEARHAAGVAVELSQCEKERSLAQQLLEEIS